MPLDFGGQRWIARFHSRPEFDRITASPLPAGIGLAGALLALIALLWHLRSQHHQRDIAAYAEQLQHSEAQLRTLIDTMPDAVCLKDGEGRLIEANTVFLRLCGLDDVDYRGKTCRELTRGGQFADSTLAGLERFDETACDQAATSRRSGDPPGRPARTGVRAGQGGPVHAQRRAPGPGHRRPRNHPPQADRGRTSAPSRPSRRDGRRAHRRPATGQGSRRGRQPGQEPPSWPT